MENNKYSNRFDGIREVGQWTAVTTNFLNFIIKRIFLNRLLRRLLILKEPL